MSGASMVPQTVKNLPSTQETWVRLLGQEDLLEKGMATYSSILAWKIPQTEVPGRLQSMGSQRIMHEWVTNTLIKNIRVKVSLWDNILFSLDIYSEVRFLDHTVVLCLISWETSIMTAPFNIPINSVWGFSFLHILADTCLLNNNHSNTREVISYCGFDLHLPDD